MRPFLARLPTRRAAQTRSSTASSRRPRDDSPAFTLDYWRLNMSATRAVAAPATSSLLVCADARTHLVRLDAVASSRRRVARARRLRDRLVGHSRALVRRVGTRVGVLSTRVRGVDLRSLARVRAASHDDGDAGGGARGDHRRRSVRRRFSVLQLRRHGDERRQRRAARRQRANLRRARRMAAPR